jgi:hypothetical protein
MNEEFKLHDLVVVVKQPEMQNVYLVGLMAVITEIDGEYATISELQLSGNAGCTGSLYGGGGAVELSCLEKPKSVSAPMRAAYAVYKQHIIQNEIQNDLSKNTIKKRRQVLKTVATAYQIEPKILHKILKDLDALEVIKYEYNQKRI